MAYVQKPGTGTLWINDRKTKDTHPDRTGTLVMEDGVEYFIDGWLKESNGKKFLSLSVKRKNKQAAPQEQQQTRTAPATTRRPTPPPSDPDLDAPSNSDEIF